MSEKLTANSNISHYRIVSKLGEGGMGEVYLAHDTRLNRKVALKVLPADVVSNRERLHRFTQEAQAASALNHPNIITIHEVGAEGDTHFIATEFIEGRTLRQKLQTRLELAEILDIATQIAAALDAAHRSRIVHRDIKPENVMLRADGLVKVLDFGLAKLAEKKDDTPADTQAPTRALVKTNPGVVMGTVAYMSPEQARGLKVDARTDVFSLGVVLYEMLAGSLPFAGATASDMVAAILKAEPAPLGENVPAELKRIVRKSLRKDADERYQTAKDLLIDLKALKREQDFAAEFERFGIPTRADQPAPTQDQNIHTASSAGYNASGIKKHKGGFALALAALLLAALGFGYWFYNQRRSSTATNIESIAVLPFVNASGDPNLEYLSDGVTESLINSLSQLPDLAVKARGTAFRYKGKESDPQKVGSELNVQAVLSGRLAQRGDDLTLSLDLVDTGTGNQVWGEQYNRKLTDLVALQREIARDVSRKLRARLSGADEQKLAKNYTANTEANQLYLKGRFHVFKLTPPEVHRGISYFQQAIAIDPSYALAYAGLSDAYRSLALGGEMLPTEFLPKAKAAAQKAIDIDDSLAEAHTTFGMNVFWHDWDWNAAENRFKRALELNPNSADAHLYYAHLLSNTGRHEEALIEVKRARELDPLSPFVNALEGQFLIHAGRADEALARLQKTSELEPNFWMAHLFASGAYVEKGMYTEAIAEARQTTVLAPAQTTAIAFGGYALAKSGKRDEARAALNELLKLSTERFLPPYHIALVYNGLDMREETLDWLGRGYRQRDPKMTFLKVDRKWNNLRSDPRFADLVRKVGLPQ